MKQCLSGLVLRLYTASPPGPLDPTFGLQMEGCIRAFNVFVSFDRNLPFPMCLCQGEDELLMVIEGDVFVFIFLLYLRLNVCNQVEDDLPLVVEEEVLGGGEEIEQEKKFTRPRFVQVRFVGFLAFFHNSKII